MAVKYDIAKDRAPRIVAKGRGELAERMIAIAREKKVPIHEDPELMEALARLDIETEIPTELYQVMAEILTFIYRTSRKKAEAGKGT